MPEGENMSPVQTKTFVNCYATATVIPEGFLILPEDQLPNQVSGLYELEPAKVELYSSAKQEKGMKIKDICEELKEKHVFPANLLDFFLKTPWCIPEGFVEKRVLFWTIYRYFDNRYIRCLYFKENEWRWDAISLNNDLSSEENFSAVLAD